MQKPLDEGNLYGAILKFCLYRERAPKEVKEKLVSKGLTSVQVKKMMKKLVDEGFVNEERFANAFASDKFRLQKWGKQKIKIELRKKGIASELITEVLSKLDEEDYVEQIRKAGAKKWESLAKTGKPEREKKQKLKVFLAGKGYSWSEISQVWDDITKTASS